MGVVFNMEILEVCGLKIKLLLFNNDTKVFVLRICNFGIYRYHPLKIDPHLVRERESVCG